MDHNQQAAIIGESSDLFNAIMHFIGYFTLACSFLSIYMILFHSTKHMRVYKYYLLNIAICCGMFDAFTGLIYTPNVLLPAFGVCMAGLWSEHMTNIWFSVSFYIIVVFLMISVSFSITTAFVYRFFLTLGMDQKFQRCRTIVLIVLIYFALVGPVVSLFGYAMLYDPPLTNKLIKEAHPAIYKFSQHKPCIFMSAKLTPKAVIIGTSAVMVINFASMVINLILVFVILRRLKQDKDKFSHTTHAMHRQLTISLAFSICYAYNLYGTSVNGYRFTNLGWPVRRHSIFAAVSNTNSSNGTSFRVKLLCNGYYDLAVQKSNSRVPSSSLLLVQ
ncbi:hypothetical protein M3Y97_00642800 [Aphelenchoides bicaudatus]|nr:hypothetical protein M3Y97_00642800 [Aphelenchoides bicaudatus]